MTSLLKRILLGALLFAAASSPAARAQQAPSEYEVKAAFLFNFLKFVEWPPRAFAQPNSPYAIGVLGDDPFNRFLEQAVAEKTINDRKIVVKRSAQLGDLKGCHLIFISASERSQCRKILSSLESAAVLTVGDFSSFAEQGGMINFTMTANKVRFEINPKAAQQAGLKISFKLLNVAKIVSP